MGIARELAGYPLRGADLLCRAIEQPVRRGPHDREYHQAVVLEPDVEDLREAARAWEGLHGIPTQPVRNREIRERAGRERDVDAPPAMPLLRARRPRP
ncbi:hypothetical protein ACH4VR_28115 [Streptomyces sp. NPDC020883]|uniref:hypothetical protein n=1 Tax=Streptomyces sp. NPDC020883 TaxID=3365099 RepID=UPI0037896775